MSEIAKFMSVVALWCIFISPQARASEGPWTTPKGLHNIYSGVFFERFNCYTLAGETADGCSDDAVAVESPVEKYGVKIFYRTGLTKRLDIAVSAPVIHATTQTPSSSANYAPTTGIGVVQSRVRARLPSVGGIDTAASLGVESGVFHAATRGRVTNVGDGTHGITGALYAGSTGLVGRRFYDASADLSYVFRVPLDSSDAGRIPGDELRFASVTNLGLGKVFGVGFSVDGQMRLWGEDLDPAALTASFGGEDDSLRWASLAASQVKVGGRIVAYPGPRRPYLLAGISRAVWVKNNPTDTTFVEVATGFDIGRRKP